MTSVLQKGRTRAAPVPCSGHTAPNSRSIGYADHARLGDTSPSGPAVGELVLLADPHLVLEPDLHRCTRRELGGLPPRGRQSFFERLHGARILLVGFRPRADTREAQVLQGAVDGVVRHREAELLVQQHHQRSHARQRTTPPSSTRRGRNARCFLRSLGGMSKDRMGHRSPRVGRRRSANLRIGISRATFA